MRKIRIQHSNGRAVFGQSKRVAKRWGFTLLAGCLSAPMVFAAITPRMAPLDKSQVQQTLGGLSIPFEQNTGQFDAGVAFLGKTFAGSVQVMQDGKIVYRLPGKPTSSKDTQVSTVRSTPLRQAKQQERGPGWQLSETLVNAAALPPQGLGQAPTQVSRFTPNGHYQSTTWLSVMVGEPWPGIALELATRGNNVEKLFHVAPGADVSRIAVQLGGATQLSIADDGSLVVGTGNGNISYTAPVAWQDIEGQRVPVAVSYAIDAATVPGQHSAKTSTSPRNQAHYGFTLASYDKNYSLVIDPLIQSTYLGGAENDYIDGLAIDSNGDVVVAGHTASDNLPCTTEDAVTGCADGAQEIYHRLYDGFVARLSGDLRTLKQSTYMGGSRSEEVHSMVINSHGDVLIGGTTASQNLFCTEVTSSGCANGAQKKYGGGDHDAFIAKLSSDLKTLQHGTYLGGSGNDRTYGLAIDSNGDVLIGGTTSSPNLPCTAENALTGCANGAQPVINGVKDDGFVARLSSDLTILKQSTYLGGSGFDGLIGLAIDNSGEVLVAGYTSSTDLPCTSKDSKGCADGAQKNHGSSFYDGFVARLSGDLTILRQSTYLGGSDNNDIRRLAIDSSGDVVIAGSTRAKNLFCTGSATTGCAKGAQKAFGGGTDDGFVARLSSNLTSFKQSTFLGGSGQDTIYALDIDNSGDVLVGGFTASNNLPCTRNVAPCADGIQKALGGGDLDGFVARLSGDLSILRQSSYLGGSGEDRVRRLVIDSHGDVLVAGETSSDNMFCTGSAINDCTDGTQKVWGGKDDAFIARLPSNLKAFSSQNIAFEAQMSDMRLFVNGGTFALAPAATATSGLPVTHSSKTPTVCTVNGTTVTMLAAGICTITASQAGNANWQAAVDVSQSVTIDKGVNTITFAVQTPAIQTFTAGKSFVLNPVATATSGLPVTHSSKTPTVCTVNGTTVTMLAAGICTITASQAGNANWQAAVDVSQSVTIDKGVNTITFAVQTPAIQTFTAGKSFVLNPVATATSGLPVTHSSKTPTVCTVNGTTVTMLAAGICTITASQAGNANWQAAVDVSQSVTIDKGVNTITFAVQTPAIQTFTAGKSFVLNPVATATSGLPVTHSSKTPTVCTVNGTTVTMLAAGICTITASQAGNANWQAAVDVSQSVTIDKGVNTITFAVQTPAIQTFTAGKSFVLNPVATATSGLPVTHSSKTPTVCTVNGTTVTMLAAGICTITASQAGNANWQAAVDVSQSVTIDKGVNTITFAVQTPAIQTFTAGKSFVLNPVATATSGLPVTHSSKTPTVCTVNGTTVTMVTAGTCSVEASQKGDANYVAAAPQSQSVELEQALINVLVNSTPNPSLPGQGVTFTVSVSPIISKSAKTFTKASPVPTGTLSLSDGSAALGSATLDASGEATLTVSTLTIEGGHSIVASYSGDVNYPATQSDTFTQTVHVATPTPVPSLSTLGIVLLNLIATAFAALGLRRKRVTARV